MRYDIHLASHEFLEIYSQIYMIEKADGFIKSYQKIYVASLLLRAARIGSEHTDLLNVILPLQFRPVLLDDPFDLIKARDFYLTLCSHVFIITSSAIAHDAATATGRIFHAIYSSELETSVR